MTATNRRTFLAETRNSAVALAAGAAILPSAGSARAAAATPANERIVLAVVGVRSRGNVLAGALAARPDCRIAYLCDADSTLLPSRADAVAKIQGGAAPKCVPDFRTALDDKTVDALVVATPDHWHCLAAIWACQAGKDVHVEAPLSHCAWEGRRAVEAAQKHKRVVQVGLETRNAAYAHSAKAYIDEGKLGKIHLCRVFDQKGQANFAAKPDSRTPKGLDWDMWNGPAPEAAYNVNYQNNWHGWWRYSGGDMAVDGIHQFDLARWLCGVTVPKTVYATGGRLDSAGANETPDTLTALYEFDKLLLTFELTLYTPYMQKVSPAIRAGEMYPHWPQCGQRVELYGSEGVMVVAPHGGSWQVFARPRRETPTVEDQERGHSSDAEHLDDFVKSIRTRRPLQADVEDGHLSALLVHYANISLRTGGQKLIIDPKTAQILDNREAASLLRRSYRKPWTIS
jgi:predicted dehydrogenase